MKPISEAWMAGLAAALKAERIKAVEATAQWLAENRKEAIRTIDTRSNHNDDAKNKATRQED